MKRPRESIRTRRPTLSDASLDRTVLRIERDKPFINRFATPNLMLIAHPLRIKREAIRSFNDDKLCRRQRAIDIRRRDEREQQKQKRRKNLHTLSVADACLSIRDGPCANAYLYVATASDQRFTSAVKAALSALSQVLGSTRSSVERGALGRIERSTSRSSTSALLHMPA